MRIDELDYGSHYTIRGAEELVLIAWRNDECWWLEEEEGGATYQIDGHDLIVCDIFGEPHRPSGWTLDDVVPDSAEAAAIASQIDAHIDGVARDLLADVNI